MFLRELDCVSKYTVLNSRMVEWQGLLLYIVEDVYLD